MSESDTGLVILVGVTVLGAALAHWRIRRYVAASVISAVVGAVVFQVLAALQLGYVDPFAPVAFVLSLLVTVPLAFLIGRFFLFHRRPRSASRAEP